MIKRIVEYIALSGNLEVNDTTTPVTKIRVVGLAKRKLSAIGMSSILTQVNASGKNMSLFSNKGHKQTANPFKWNDIEGDCSYITPDNSDRVLDSIEID